MCHLQPILTADISQIFLISRKTVSALIKQYVRNGSKPSVDYNTYLTDPMVAGKLLEELQKQLPIIGVDQVKAGTKDGGGK